MFGLVPAAATAPSESAARACAYLFEISPEMRGCAILGADGTVLGANGERQAWPEPAAELIAAADEAGGEPVAQAHIGTGDGEVFMVRVGGLVAIAVAERHTLASLMLFDLRKVLRDLIGGGGER
jgi:predicted regulator of Ras-like GTPase activity (Roadblock/LC7/MglB family)